MPSDAGRRIAGVSAGFKERFYTMCLAIRRVGAVTVLLCFASATPWSRAAPPSAANGQPGVVTGPPAEAAAADEKAQLERCVRVMKSELEQAESRVDAVRKQLRDLDGDIESRVNRIVSLLSAVRDSTDSSGTRIRRAKQDALAGLKAAALYYAQERDKRRKAMADPASALSDEDLTADIAALNARIETRVTQSLAVAASLTQYAEGRIEKHRNLETDYSSETQEFQKLRRDARASAKAKADLVDALRASIEKLDRERTALEAECRETDDSAKETALLKEIEHRTQLIEVRRGQVEELLTATPPATKAVSPTAAFELDKLLDEMLAELRRDIGAFRRLVAEFDAARARVKPLRGRLEKATAALAALDTAPAAGD